MSKHVSAAFVDAQKAFGPALRKANNPFFKSKYADLAMCVEAIIGGLHANDIALIQKNHPCNEGVAVETVFLHASGEEISGGILEVPAAKRDPQAFGSALTYARRYSLMAACGMAPEDDDGNAANQGMKAQAKIAANRPPFKESFATVPTMEALKALWQTLNPQEQAACVSFRDEAKIRLGENPLTAATGG